MKSGYVWNRSKRGRKQFCLLKSGLLTDSKSCCWFKMMHMAFFFITCSLCYDIGQWLVHRPISSMRCTIQTKFITPSKMVMRWNKFRIYLSPSATKNRYSLRHILIFQFIHKDEQQYQVCITLHLALYSKIS